MARLSIPEAMELGMQHHRSGNIEQAESIYRQILAIQPDQSDALHLLGLLGLGRKRHAKALELIDSAIARHPDEPAYHYSRAQVLQGWQKRQEAIESYRQAVALRPDFVEAHNNLGMLLFENG